MNCIVVIQNLSTLSMRQEISRETKQHISSTGSLRMTSFLYAPVVDRTNPFTNVLISLPMVWNRLAQPYENH